MSLPLVLLATVLGRAANRRMDAGPFILYVHFALIAIGVILLGQAAW
jgi:hypothetical protein